MLQNAGRGGTGIGQGWVGPAGWRGGHWAGAAVPAIRWPCVVLPRHSAPAGLSSSAVYLHSAHLAYWRSVVCTGTDYIFRDEVWFSTSPSGAVRCNLLCPLQHRYYGVIPSRSHQRYRELTVLTAPYKFPVIMALVLYLKLLVYLQL